MNNNVRSIETNQLVKNILARGYWILTEDDDGDTEMCTTFKEVTKVMDNLDEVTVCIIQKTTNKRLGWFLVNFFNEGVEQISDYTANDLCEKIYKQVEEKASSTRQMIIEKYGN